MKSSRHIFNVHRRLAITWDFPQFRLEDLFEFRQNSMRWSTKKRFFVKVQRIFIRSGECIEILRNSVIEKLLCLKLKRCKSVHVLSISRYMQIKLKWIFHCKVYFDTAENGPCKVWVTYPPPTSAKWELQRLVQLLVLTFSSLSIVYENTLSPLIPQGGFNRIDLFEDVNREIQWVRSVWMEMFHYGNRFYY